MIVGAIGPWLTSVGGLVSVGGLDGGRDGWWVIVVAAIALVILAALFFGSANRIAWGVPILGLLGLAVAAIDRRDVNTDREFTLGDAFTKSGKPTGDPLFEVGWGLNLAMGAAFSLVAASSLVLLTRRSDWYRRAALVPRTIIGVMSSWQVFVSAVGSDASHRPRSADQNVAERNPVAMQRRIAIASATRYTTNTS